MNPLVLVESGPKTRIIGQKKHVKRAGLRKNAPYHDISCLSGCCKKECFKKFSQQHLSKIRGDFEALNYKQQNIYLNGLLHRHETKKTTGHKRKSNPAVSSSGKRLGRPSAEESKFSFDYCLNNEKGVTIKVCQMAFCRVHAFGPKRLQVLWCKITSAGEEGIIWDKRSKHSNHGHVSDDVRDRKIEEARVKGEQTTELEQEHDAHKILAQRGYQAFYHDQKLSEES